MRLLYARVIAVLVAAPTFAVLITADRMRLDHLFFVPDVILCAALVVSAALPHRFALPALRVSFAFAAGVITTAVFSYVARGALEEGVPTVAVALVCVATAVALSFTSERRTVRPPAARTRSSTGS